MFCSPWNNADYRFIEKPTAAENSRSEKMRGCIYCELVTWFPRKLFPCGKRNEKAAAPWTSLTVAVPPKSLENVKMRQIRSIQEPKTLSLLLPFAHTVEHRYPFPRSRSRRWLMNRNGIELMEEVSHPRLFPRSSIMDHHTSKVQSAE